MIANGHSLGVQPKEQAVPQPALSTSITTSVATLVAVALVAFVAAAPFTWLLMLFLGNVGTHIGFWGCLPGGVLVGLLVAGSARS